MGNINKGMILAAGLGTRMLPLTITTPKALLDLNGKKLIDYSLEVLKGGGVREVIVNLHHLGDLIEKYLGREKYGMKMYYSKEPEILGTGGGIKKAQDFFDGDDFAVINCDAIFDINLKEVVAFHKSQDAVATMVLKDRGHSTEYNGVSVEDEKIVGFDSSGGYFYTGLQILSKKMLEVLPPAGKKSCVIEDGYKRLISKGDKIAGYLHKKSWIDIGTIEKYRKEINGNKWK